MKAIRKLGLFWLKAVPAFLLLFLCLVAPFGQKATNQQNVEHTIVSNDGFVQFAKALDLSPSPFILEPSTGSESAREITPDFSFSTDFFLQSARRLTKVSLLEYFYVPDQRRTSLQLLFPYHHFW